MAKSLSLSSGTEQKPLRFCMITTFYPPYNFGGDGIFIERLSQELVNRGHHVEVIHCVDSYRILADHLPDTDSLNHSKVVVHRLKSPFGFLSPLATQLTGRPLFKSKSIKQILNKGFDVINYHNISLVGGPKVLQYGQGLKIYTLHEYWLVCPTHTLFKFKREACRSKSCLLCGLVYKRPPQLWRYTGLIKSSVKHLNAVISPDLFTIDMHKSMGLDLPFIHLPHFVPQEKSPGIASQEHMGDSNDGRALNEPATDSPYFLFVGRLEKLKGLQSVIPLFNRFRKAKLLIAGTGDYGRKLKKIAHRNENVVFLGFQSGANLLALYRNARAIIVPSINYEVAPPLCIMEAFQYKTPAIVRKLGSMPEIIDDSDGGLVYENDTQLLSALERLSENTALRDELGHNGYQAFKEKWTADAYLDRYFALIEDLMSNPKKKPANA